jgi:hypothetical protein
MMDDEEIIDFVAREAWAELYHSPGALTLQEYAAPYIMKKQHETARVYLKAYMKALDRANQKRF